MELFNQAVATVTFKTKQETIKGEFTFCNGSFFDAWQRFLNNNDQTTFRAMQFTAMLCTFIKAFRDYDTFAFENEIPNPLTVKSIEISFASSGLYYQRHGFTLKYKVKKLSSGDGYLRLYGNLISRDDILRTKPIMVSDSFEVMTLVVGGNMVLHEVNSLIEKFKERVTHFSKDMKLYVEPRIGLWLQHEYYHESYWGGRDLKDRMGVKLKILCLQHPQNQNAMTVRKDIEWDLLPGSYSVGHGLEVKETETGLHLRLQIDSNRHGFTYVDHHIRTLPYDGLLVPLIDARALDKVASWDDLKKDEPIWFPNGSPHVAIEE